MSWTKKKSKNFKEVVMWCRSEAWGDFIAVGFYVREHTEDAEKRPVDWDTSFELDYDKENDRYYVPGGWYVILNTGNCKEIYKVDDNTEVIAWQKITPGGDENDLRGQRSDDANTT